MTTEIPCSLIANNSLFASRLRLNMFSLMQNILSRIPVQTLAITLDNNIRIHYIIDLQTCKGHHIII